MVRWGRGGNQARPELRVAFAAVTAARGRHGVRAIPLAGRRRRRHRSGPVGGPLVRDGLAVLARRRAARPRQGTQLLPVPRRLHGPEQTTNRDAWLMSMFG